ncbi:unnamed protein product [Euphydryas editha]|uniref:Secreted protein n=1 Tax=Euphydryas editha TaxID=104508 RepID=A0AAU9V6I7_EUPED|nr:unnamed protein product [Euphydryas editha]
MREQVFDIRGLIGLTIAWYLVGEEERCVSLCSRTARGAIPGQFGGWHRPKAAYGFSVLEFPPGQTHWRNGCPFIRSSSPVLQFQRYRDE